MRACVSIACVCVHSITFHVPVPAAHSRGEDEHDKWRSYLLGYSGSNPDFMKVALWPCFCAALCFDFRVRAIHSVQYWLATVDAGGRVVRTGTIASAADMVALVTLHGTYRSVHALARVFYAE